MPVHLLDSLTSRAWCGLSMLAGRHVVRVPTVLVVALAVVAVLVVGVTVVAVLVIAVVVIAVLVVAVPVVAILGVTVLVVASLVIAYNAKQYRAVCESQPQQFSALGLT